MPMSLRSLVSEALCMWFASTRPEICIAFWTYQNYSFYMISPWQRVKCNNSGYIKSVSHASLLENKQGTCKCHICAANSLFIPVVYYNGYTKWQIVVLKLYAIITQIANLNLFSVVSTITLLQVTASLHWPAVNYKVWRKGIYFNCDHNVFR